MRCKERQVSIMIIEDEIVRFKMQLLRKMPFYGDIVMRLPIVRNDSVPTAQTNGRTIEYNAKILSGMREGQRNFVIMHEIFHVLLFHCDRRMRDARASGTRLRI